MPGLEDVEDRKKADAEKGRHVLNQSKLYNDALDARFQLHGVVSMANQLGRPAAGSLDAVEREALGLVDCVLETQAVLLAQFPALQSLWGPSTVSGKEHASDASGSDEIASSDDESIASSAVSIADGAASNDQSEDESIEESVEEAENEDETGPKMEAQEQTPRPLEGESTLDAHWRQLESEWPRFVAARDATILKWSNKVNAAKLGASMMQSNKLQVLGGTALDALRAVLADRERLLRRTQLKRMDYARVGAEIPTADAKEAHDAEIFDDVDFYQTQLRQQLGSQLAHTDDAVALARKWADFRALQKMAQRRRLKNRFGQDIDRKASKGRRLRYDVHEKLVGFMAGRPMPVPEAILCQQRSTESQQPFRVRQRVPAAAMKDFEFDPSEFD